MKVFTRPRACCMGLFLFVWGIVHGSLGPPVFAAPACDNKCRMRYSLLECLSGNFYYYTGNTATCVGCSSVSTYRCLPQTSDKMTGLTCKPDPAGTMIEWNRMQVGTRLCPCPSTTQKLYVEANGTENILESGMELLYTCQ